MSQEHERETVNDVRPDDESEVSAATGGRHDDGSGDGQNDERSGGVRHTRRRVLRTGAAGVGALGTGCIGRIGESGSRPGTGNGTDRRGSTVNATADTTTSTEQPSAGPPDTSGMELVIEDSFADGGLDASTWWDKYPWDARTHNYDGYAAPENVFVEDDVLVLQAEKEPREGRQFTTGVVSAKEVFAPGYFEASIKIPPMVPGFWPAYWLTSASYHPPEIDIFEFSEGDGLAYMTYHYANDEGETRKVRDTFGGPEFSADFHTYAVDWNPPERIVWYIDGAERFRYEGPYVSDEYCYLILNFGIDPPDGPSPDPKHLPARYEVDWIRCWER